MGVRFRRGFQFQDGAVKRTDFCVTESALTKFQFQDGAVKSLTITQNDRSIHLFQFQDGAVKRNTYSILYLSLI